MSTAPRWLGVPQMVAVDSAGPQLEGTLMVTGLSVFHARLTANVGLIPVGWAYFQNSARWKASVTWPVPIAVPPHVQDWLLTIGEFCVRLSGLAPGSQLSVL